MQVVNVSVKNIRPQWENLRSWAEDKENLYVGRAGIVFIDGVRYPKEDSPFCNPYRIGRDGDRSVVLQKFREYMRTRPDLIAKLMEAAKNKKRLGCWCAPEECHADVLREIISSAQ
jgi:hypothetical protein